MNVYAIKAYGNYGGGMAVVAADSEEEALEVAGQIVDQIWYVQYRRPESVEQLPCHTVGLPRVSAHYETGE